MANCTIFNWQGKESGELSIDLKTAKESTAVDLLHRAVLRQQAHIRQGTASTLTRSEVRGGGRKPYKQKGTGRARQGSIRTPLRPGGGITFGPKPRKYNLDMNRKERRLALRTALMSRISDAKIIKNFGSKLEVPKTSEIVSVLKRVGIDSDGKILIILNRPSEIIKRSIRNLEKIKLISADQLNVFDLLNANSLVIGEDALSTIKEVYGND